MEKIIELSDSYIFKYPQYFQTFLDNCLNKYKESFGANDYLFAAVYFLIMEAGFTPVDPSGKFDCDSVNFDIRRLRSVICYNDDQIKISKQSNKSNFLIYQIPLKLGKHCLNLCELQGVPSAEVDAHLIINFLSKEPHIVKSLCLNTETYILKIKTNSEHKYFLKSLKELSILIKNKIAVHVKDLILTNEEEGCSANLLCLPEEIQKKIIYFLQDDPISIQYLSSSCSYFYNFISKDAKLWEKICFHQYSGWTLNKALQDMSISGDTNLFRSAFFMLKLKEARSTQTFEIDILLLFAKSLLIKDIQYFLDMD